MSIVYTADIFCDECNNWIHGTTGRKPPTRHDVLIAIRQRDVFSVATKWKLSKDNHDLCPKCATDNLGKAKEG